MSSRYALPFLLLALACGGGGGESSTEEPSTGAESNTPSTMAGDLDAVLAGAHRSEIERGRDRYRHPKETLAFFGLEPSSTVVEIWPGRGWYTKVLAPYLRGNGRLIIANVDPNGEGFVAGMARDLNLMLASSPDRYDEVELAQLHAGEQLATVPDSSVDLVLLPRTIHNWVRHDHDIEAYLAAIVRVLKPGGVLGIVQHRAPADHPEAESGEAGYLSEEFVIRMVESAGLTLDERSEINGNPSDDHDHPEGVWSLPPSLRGDEASADEMRAVGESDRMTLRFVKSAG